MAYFLNGYTKLVKITKQLHNGLKTAQKPTISLIWNKCDESVQQKIFQKDNKISQDYINIAKRIKVSAHIYKNEQFGRLLQKCKFVYQNCIFSEKLAELAKITKSYKSD